MNRRCVVLILTGFILSLAFWRVAHADLAQDLRQLRNTISETSKTGKELGNLTGYGSDAGRPANAATPTTAASGLHEGDVLVGKIANIKLYQEADKKARIAAKLGHSDELIYTGVEANGFYSVASNNGDGWVEKVLVKKR